MAYSFTDKSVWVTGASSGIGMALAKRLLNKGAKVIVTARNEDILQSVFAENNNALVLAGDITSLKVNQEIVAKAQKYFGRIDCAIFNAGTAEYIDAKNFSSEPFERMMEANFLSMVKGIYPSHLKMQDSARLETAIFEASNFWASHSS